MAASIYYLTTVRQFVTSDPQPCKVESFVPYDGECSDSEVIYTKLPEAEGNAMPGLSTQPPLVLHTQPEAAFQVATGQTEDPEEHCANLGPKNGSDVRGTLPLWISTKELLNLLSVSVL